MAGRCLAQDSHKMNKKNNTEITEIIEPTLATTFQYSSVSGKSEYRRGIPANPKKCIGKKVTFTPINIITNWAFSHLGFIVSPTISGNQLTIPAISPNTAPILKT